MNMLTEQEAAVCIFYTAVSFDGNLTDFEIHKVSNTLVTCRKFEGLDFKEVLAKYFDLKSKFSDIELLKHAARYVTEDFKKTLFAMICDLLCSDGETSDTDVNLMIFMAGHIGIEEEYSTPIANTFMLRYTWNYQIV